MDPENGTRMGTISHRTPVVHTLGRPPMTFTIDVASTDQDTFPLTCRELPEVMISCADECDGPAKAEVAIQLALQIAGRSPDLSF